MKSLNNGQLKKIESMMVKRAQMGEVDNQAAEILNALVGHFGEDERVEIEDSLDQDWYGNPQAWEFSADGGEWVVVEDYNVAVSLAEQRMKDMIDEMGVLGTFNPDFAWSYIDHDSLLRWYAEAEEEHYYNEDPEELIEMWGLDEEDLDGMSAEEYVNEHLAEKARESGENMMDEDLDQLKQGQEPTYMPKEQFAQFIDEDRLIEDAISTDGWEHGLASYDGNSVDLEGSYIAFRIN